MTPLNTNDYRPIYDPDAWTEILRDHPATDPRAELLISACLAIRALCDEVDSLRVHAEALAEDMEQFMDHMESLSAYRRDYPRQEG